jgi:hypothetical protein
MKGKQKYLQVNKNWKKTIANNYELRDNRENIQCEQNLKQYREWIIRAWEQIEKENRREKDS